MPCAVKVWRQPDAAMIASSWLRKVSNTCSSHSKRNRFKAVDNGLLLRITKAGTLAPPAASHGVTRMLPPLWGGSRRPRAMQNLLGAFPCQGSCARRRPWTNRTYWLAGIWQDRLSGRDRAARCPTRKRCRRVIRVGRRWSRLSTQPVHWRALRAALSQHGAFGGLGSV